MSRTHQIRYRLLRVGLHDEQAVVVLPIWEHEGTLVLHTRYATEQLTTGRTLEEIGPGDLPRWLLDQPIPFEITPARTATGATHLEAWDAMLEAAEAEYGIPPRAEARATAARAA